MAKVNDFENGLSTSMDQRSDSLTFDKKSNIHFVSPSMDELVNSLSGLANLFKMITLFREAQKVRLNILERYSNGDNYSILAGRRRIEEEKSDYRVRHNIGGYISKFVTGYTASKPITIAFKGSDDDRGTKDLEEVAAINENNDIDALNYDLAYDASRFGRAFELHYRNENNEDSIVLIDAQEMFVIRDTTVNQRLIGAVHCPIYNNKIYVTVYTDSEIIRYKPMGFESTQLQEEERQQHFYGTPPVVEWWNNRHRLGDFENCISLIDAYDAAESDTANYMSDLNDALLVINGDLNAAGIDADSAQKMKQANILLLESGLDSSGKQTNLSAGYIYKQYDVNGTEAYKNRLLNDIFKLANVPNLDDKTFGSADSGIALQFKLIGLQQIQVIKENFYSKALTRRYQIIQNLHKALHEAEIDANALTFVFHPNIPQDVWSEVTQYISAGGEISQETLRTLASFTENKLEQGRLENERSPDLADDELAFNQGKRVDDEEADE